MSVTMVPSRRFLSILNKFIVAEDVPSEDVLSKTRLDLQEALNRLSKCEDENRELHKLLWTSVRRTKNLKIQLLRKKFNKMMLKARKEKDDLIVLQAANTTELTKQTHEKKHKLKKAIYYYKKITTLYSTGLRNMQLQYQAAEENLNALTIKLESSIKKNRDRYCISKRQCTGTSESKLKANKHFSAIQKPRRQQTMHLPISNENNDSTVMETLQPSVKTENVQPQNVKMQKVQQSLNTAMKESVQPNSVIEENVQLLAHAHNHCYRIRETSESILKRSVKISARQVGHQPLLIPINNKVPILKICKLPELKTVN